ncbi:hypothetical protein ASZ90_016956 [hydrocarbon metagenome]|uniref:Uncharacterized protein n=1 Tax=hydrocarbon metagenome TaxID=938273 RepID=A0A0W8EAF4_9ZZZZ
MLSRINPVPSCIPGSLLASSSRFIACTYKLVGIRQMQAVSFPVDAGEGHPLPSEIA